MHTWVKNDFLFLIHFKRKNGVNSKVSTCTDAEFENYFSFPYTNIAIYMYTHKHTHIVGGKKGFRKGGREKGRGLPTLGLFTNISYKLSMIIWLALANEMWISKWVSLLGRHCAIHTFPFSCRIWRCVWRWVLHQPKPLSDSAEQNTLKINVSLVQYVNFINIDWERGFCVLISEILMGSFVFVIAA